jgi:hypothetical protein
MRSDPPLGDSHGARSQNFLRVGLSVMVNTCSSWRCAMRKAHDSLSSAGELGEDRGSGDGSVTIVCDTELMVVCVCAPCAREGRVMPQILDGGGYRRDEHLSMFAMRHQRVAR